MDPHRKFILIAGPILLTGICFLLTLDSGKSSRQAVPKPISVDVVSPLKNDTTSRLRQLCENASQEIGAQLERGHAVLIRPPYVIAGDMPEDVLERLYRDVVQPTDRALRVGFFDIQPTEPITIVAFAKEAAFRDFARRIDHRQPESYYGYYLRSNRRLVVNVSTGAGTVAHELSHALAHFDFPNMPEWFDEGLASVFEQSEFAEMGHRLTGTDNWRVHHVLRALHDNCLRKTHELMQGRSVRADDEAIDYAHARYVCLYLQDQQLLEPFYRKLRANSGIDATGWQTLREILAMESAAEIDADFRRWVVKYHKLQRQRTARNERYTLSMKPVETTHNQTEVIAADVGAR